MKGDVIQSSHRFHGPCSACGDGDTELKYHSHERLQLQWWPCYTLVELTTLCQEYALEMENSEEGRQDINLRLTMSSLLAWLAKREQGKGDE